MPVSKNGKELLLNILFNKNENENKNTTLHPNIIVDELNTTLVQDIKAFLKFDDVKKINIVKTISTNNFLVIIGNYNNVNGFFVVLDSNLKIVNGFNKIKDLSTGTLKDLDFVLNVFIGIYNYLFLTLQNFNDKKIYMLKINDVFANVKGISEIFPIINKELINEKEPVSQITNQPIYNTLESVEISQDLQNEQILNFVYYYRIPTLAFPNARTFYWYQWNSNSLEDVFQNEISLPWSNPMFNEFFNIKFRLFSDYDEKNDTKKFNIGFFIDGGETSKQDVKRTINNESFSTIENLIINLKKQPDIYSNFQINNIDYDSLYKYDNVACYTTETGPPFINMSFKSWVGSMLSQDPNLDPNQVIYLMNGIIQPMSNFQKDVTWLNVSYEFYNREIAPFENKRSFYSQKKPLDIYGLSFSYFEKISIVSDSLISLMQLELDVDNKLTLKKIQVWDKNNENINSCFDISLIKDVFYISHSHLINNEYSLKIAIIQDLNPLKDEISFKEIESDIALSTPLFFAAIPSEKYGTSLVGGQSFNKNTINSITFFYVDDLSKFQGVNNFLQTLKKVNDFDIKFCLGIRENNLLTIFNFNQDLSKCVITNISYDNGLISTDPYFFLPYSNVNQNTNLVRAVSSYDTSKVFDNTFFDYAINSNNIIFSTEILENQLNNPTSFNWHIFSNTNNEILNWNNISFQKNYNQIINLNFDIIVNFIDYLNDSKNPIFRNNQSNNFINCLVGENDSSVFSNNSMNNLKITFDDSTTKLIDITDYIFYDSKLDNWYIQLSMINFLPKTITTITFLTKNNIIVCEKNNLEIKQYQVLNFQMKIDVL